TPPHVPVPDAITAPVPAEWTWDEKDANSTRCSQVATLSSTDRARCCLTAVIRRQPVLSAWYGRWQHPHTMVTEYRLQRKFKPIGCDFDGDVVRLPRYKNPVRPVFSTTTADE
ncbi:hypothetical protein AVEN_20442-1, partial [Araneus ventricosus]